MAKRKKGVELDPSHFRSLFTLLSLIKPIVVLYSHHNFGLFFFLFLLHLSVSGCIRNGYILPYWFVIVIGYRLASLLQAFNCVCFARCVWWSTLYSTRLIIATIDISIGKLC